MAELILGLDRDGTGSHYRGEAAVLAGSACRIIAITLNETIAPASAAEWLDFEEHRVRVERCPNARVEDYWTWKFEPCHDQSKHSATTRLAAARRAAS
jgi:hypothetical protein